MNQKIIDTLIAYKQEFDQSFKDFAYKMDMSAVFEHECTHYLNPLCKDIVPLLVTQLKENKNEKIEDYFPYIDVKYHQAIKKEVETFEKTDEQIVKKIGKTIVDNFLKELMSHAKDDEKTKLIFLSRYLKEISPSLQILIQKDPFICLLTCAQLRNPKIQNMIINNFSSNFSDKLRDFIDSQDRATFQKNILRFFCYPQDIKIDDYYKKWIGKDSLHVKFCKNILSTHYEFAKTHLKNSEKEKLRLQKKARSRLRKNAQ